MTRLKLPPYGKPLLMARRQGRGVSSIHLVYGERLDVDGRCDEACPGQHAGGHPRIVVKPSEFRPFVYDWTLVTGCHVAVFDDRPDLIAGARSFYELLGELGRFAGPVHVYRSEPVREIGGGVWVFESRFQWDAAGLAADSFRESGRWPMWWPKETEALNAPRRRTWWELHEHGRAAAA